MTKPKIIVICGPTGSGKTRFAIEMASQFRGEIVGADSMQIYRYMDIGTAKPTAAEKARVPHHMIDIINPQDGFDAAQYTQKARRVIRQLAEANIMPFVVGGTGFYIKALIHGLFESHDRDLQIRKRLQAEAEKLGIAKLYQRLQQLDPDTCTKLHPNDTYRIIRALEICEGTGKTMSSFHKSHRFSDEPFDVLQIGLQIERQTLYDRINRRVDEMIKAGLVQEIKGLLDKGYSAALRPMQSLGYRHIIAYLQGNLVWEEAVRTLKRDTRHYAKRQLTWFRRNPDVIWISPHNKAEMKNRIEEFLSGS